MMDQPEFKPVRRRWFAAREDMGRRYTILAAAEDERGFLMPCFNTWDIDEIENPHPIKGMMPITPRSLLTGNQHWSTIFMPDEAQELMDALWQAGLRPSRR